MGDMADAAINGENCSLCGVEFEHEHGFPVLCRSCWKDSTPSERRGYSLATAKGL